MHWARDAAEANAIVVEVARAHGASEVVKVKSLTTDEIELNDALADAGIHALETDFAELILQLDGDWSSHILVPAIHRNRTEIRDLFARTIAPGIESDDPRDLAEASRVYLRERFLDARVGVSGANFGDRGDRDDLRRRVRGQRPHVHDTAAGARDRSSGSRSSLPTFADLEVFLQLLPRSSTGERMNPYTSLWTGVTDGDGPQELHVVLLDNGRTRVLADDVGRQALHCIRCSACLNVCPVYSRTGGHAYGSVYPGPIGAILTPQLDRNRERARRCRSHRASAVRATRSARSRSTSRACCCTCASKAVEAKARIRRSASRWASPAGSSGASAASRRRSASRRRPTRFRSSHAARIRKLPFPLAGWTRTRDLKAVAARELSRLVEASR